MKLLGISGKIKSGKSTVAKLLKQHLIYTGSYKEDQIFIIGFAQALKEEVAKAAGCSVEFINENKSAFRLILQGWGTDFKRNLIGENYWLHKFRDKVANLPSHSFVIVDDIRFLNELEYLTRQGLPVWRVERFTHLRGLNIDSPEHISETELGHRLNNFSAIMDNNGTLEELETLVINLWTQQSKLPNQSSTSPKI